tara:strand:- start:176 stop:448 length:273 start_codon:yes stop_codon:yes gene_type:complete
MEPIFIVSVVVSIFSLLLVLIGVPAQIRKNYKEKRSGLPLITILIALGFYISQIILFYLTDNVLPLISFSVGFVMWGVTLVQFIIYEKKV